MHLRRVQVPNFRALKNVDITFEEHRIPQIFPLASANGGGKSTLLQLIFTLLSCCADSNKKVYLANILKDYDLGEDVKPHTLAIIELAEGEKKLSLEFSCHSLSSLLSLAGVVDNSLSETIKLLTKVDAINLPRVLKMQTDSKIKRDALSSSRTKLPENTVINLSLNNSDNDLSRYSHQQKKNSEEEASAFERELKVLEVLKKVTSREDYIVYSYKPDSSHYFYYLACHIHGDKELLRKALSGVFLAAHKSQIFLFLGRKDIDLLLSEAKVDSTNKEELVNYESVVDASAKTLRNFFPYDFSVISVLTAMFNQAMENDMKVAVRTRGAEYGNEYAALFRDIENIFEGKTIEMAEDLSKIVIKTKDSLTGKEIILHPEDLSNGELRRLILYAWIRKNKIENSIVLIDEIETGLHPDWQYQIVRDLQAWAPSNQYILATHSYEVCSALTPSHVKELEPKLEPVNSSK